MDDVRGWEAGRLGGFREAAGRRGEASSRFLPD
jgi:hypothetical protein